MQGLYTRDEVVELIDKILQCTEEVRDSIDNEDTSWVGETLIELVEN
jgi:hypothetical protein